MFRSIHLDLGPIVALSALAAACSATGSSHQFTKGSGSGSGAGAGPSVGQGGGSSSSTQGAGGVHFTSSVGSTGSGKGCTMADPDVDADGDGWTPNQGDCNDCDPNVNPGAVDVAGDPNMVDSDCNGKYDPPAPCDSGLSLDDVDPQNGARAIELCQFTTESPATPQKRIWGVVDAAYVHADGTPFPAPGAQVGLQSGWGPNVHAQAGQGMMVLSSGHARTPTQPDACGSHSCLENLLTTPPPGFPQDNPNCPPSADINDDVGFQVQIRTPTNATGYSFAFKFYSMEYPFWVCNDYNDQFIALVSPPPTGSIHGNISFDSLHNPVSVNLGFFDVCDPAQVGQYAISCKGIGKSCPAAPNPYCPSGTAELQGTGFDVWDAGFGGGGATSWLVSQAPVKGGDEITVRFAMWDTGDANFDSTTLIDNFQWTATPGVSVSTTPVPQPK